MHIGGLLKQDAYWVLEVGGVAHLVIEPVGYPTDYGVTDVYVHPSHRNQGLATRMFTCVCAWADQEQVSLGLTAERFGRGGLNGAQLIRFYRKHGFRRVRGRYMERFPQERKYDQA